MNYRMTTSCIRRTVPQPLWNQWLRKGIIINTLSTCDDVFVLILTFIQKKFNVGLHESFVMLMHEFQNSYWIHLFTKINNLKHTSSCIIMILVSTSLSKYKSYAQQCMKLSACLLRHNTCTRPLVHKTIWHWFSCQLSLNVNTDIYGIGYIIIPLNEHRWSSIFFSDIEKSMSTSTNQCQNWH